MPLHRHRRPLPFLLAAASCLLALAGCGSSSNPGATGTSSPSASKLAASGLKFSDCMRSHGVPNFPDPSGSGGGIRIKIGAGLNPASPSFTAAQTACRKLLPGGGPGAGPPSPAAKAQLLTIAKCMRAHGQSDFPDPTTTAPSSPAGYSIVLGRNGVFLAIPSSIDVQSPAFKQAATVCHFGGPGGGP
jgi:hypothetical protein